MRLDTILSLAMGLSAIQSTFVYGFSSSSYLINCEPKSTLVSKSCHQHCLSPRFLFTNNNNNLQQRQYCNSRIRQTQLSSNIMGNDDGDVVDAIVEEKTAGLALDDEEENTSVRCDKISLLLFCIYMFSHVCSLHSYVVVPIRVYPLS